jgi:hypothetical protein
LKLGTVKERGEGMKKILVVVLLLSVVGCDVASTSKHSLGYALVGDQVKEVHLDDGTHCAIFQGAHGGGISCNWK